MIDGCDAADFAYLGVGQARQQVGLVRAVVFIERAQEMSVLPASDDQLAKRFGAAGGKEVDST